HELLHATVGVGVAVVHLGVAAVEVLLLDGDGDARSGLAARDVEDVRGVRFHRSTSFSSRRSVILRCSSTARRSSVSASLFMRSFAMASISATVLPVAQTM